MPDKKKKPAAKKPVIKRTTTKRRSAIPVSSVRPAAKPPIMRVVPAPVEMIEPTHDAIARRAFENWMLYLRLANDPIQNWLEAEKQLRAELNPQ